MTDARPTARHFWPQSLAGRLVLYLLAAVVVALASGFLILNDERRVALEDAVRQQILARTTTLVRQINTAPESVHERIVRNASTPRVRYELGTASIIDEDNPNRDGDIERQLTDELKPLLLDVRVSLGGEVSFRPFGPKRERPNDRPDKKGVPPRPPGDEQRPPPFRDFVGFTISMKLGENKWLNMRTVVRPAPPAVAGPAVLSMGVLALALILIVVFTVRRMTRPLAALASAAERFGRGETVEPLPEVGPSDVRQTAVAFNAMQQRLSRFIDDRTRMLAAISHDLRTPITSLRLRAEMVDDEETRAPMLATLEEMQALVEATLSFAKDEATEEQSRPIDLSALVDSIADDLDAIGKDVVFEEGERVTLTCRPNALRRAFRNLMENAVNYGHHARVRVMKRDAAVEVEVDDDGPGIPEADRERVFEPFVRLETSRSKETGGIGLGLAIARTIVRGHGGDIKLTNRAEGGLRATVHLPV